MHRKQVSLFIIITIVTINCVINAIQQLCKQAVSDAVSYLQYEDNNDDVFTFLVVMDLFFLSRHPLTALTTVAPFTPQLVSQRLSNWFRQVSSSISVPQKPHISRKLPFSGVEGRLC